MTIGAQILSDITSQQRIRSAVPWGDSLLVEMDMVRPGRRHIVPFAVRYARNGDQWQMKHADAEATQIKATPGNYFYLGNSEDGRQQAAIWSRNKSDGEARCVLSVPRRILSFDVANEHLVAVIRTDPRSQTLMDDEHYLQNREASGESSVVTTRNSVPNVGLSTDGSILRLALATTTERTSIKLFSVPDHHSSELTGECAISSEGQRIALGIVRCTDDGRRRHGMLLLSSDLEILAELWPERLDLSAPLARPGSNSFVCLGEMVSSPENPPRQYPVLIDDSGCVIELDVETNRWLIPFSWSGRDQLVCLGYEDGVRRAWVIHPEAGSIVASPATPATGPSVLSVVGSDGLVAVVRSAIDTPPEVVTAPIAHLLAESAAVEATLVPAAAVRPQGTLERLSVETSAGTLGAWLCRPTENDGGSLPVLVWCHGGPTLSWTDWSWRWNPWPFVAEGFAVLMIDPPLSLGYGQDVVDAGWGRWSTGVAAVAAELVEAVLAGAEDLDRSRVGIMGASFGGWLSLALGSLLPGVRLVVTHAAWLDLRSVARTSDQYWHWLREYGELTRKEYDQERVNVKAFSPATVVRLSHGMVDYHVPAVEAFGVHRELDAIGLDVELVVYPDEGHELRRPGNVNSWFCWALNACQEHLKAKGC